MICSFRKAVRRATSGVRANSKKLALKNPRHATEELTAKMEPMNPWNNAVSGA